MIYNSKIFRDSFTTSNSNLDNVLIIERLNLDEDLDLGEDLESRSPHIYLTLLLDSVSSQHVLG